MSRVWILSVWVAIISLWLAPRVWGEAGFQVEIFQKGSSKPLRRAEILIDGQKYYSDPKGQVMLPDGPDATVVDINKSGFESLQIERGQLKASGRAYLLPGAPDDDEIIISGTRRAEVSKKTISVQETSRIAPGGDPAQIPKLLPGVQAMPFRSEVIIRGSGPRDSRYQVDDLRVAHIFHQVGNISIIPEGLLDQVEFSSGGFSAQYGEATGGIIALRTTSQIPENDKTELKLNLPFLVAAFHETPLQEDSALSVSFRHSLTEYIIPKVIERQSKGTGISLVPTFSDVLARYLVVDPKGHYKLTAIGSNDGMVAAVPFSALADETGNAELEFSDRFGVIGLERLERLGDGDLLRATPQVYTGRQRFDAGKIRGDIDGVQIRVPTEWTNRLGKNRYLYLGVDPTWNSTRVQVTAPRINENDPFFDIEDAAYYTVDGKFTNSSLAAWSALDFEWNEFTFSPGIRAFKTTQIKPDALDPRFSLRYKLSEDWLLKGAWGLYSQPPEYQESAKNFGNPDLGFEQSQHRIVGIEGKLSSRWQLDLQLFSKVTDHLIRNDPTLGYADKGRLEANGFEVFLRRLFTERTFGWLSYTYSNARERSDSDQPMHTSQYDQPHVLNLAWSYKLNAAWELATRIKYASGEPYTPVTGGVYNANLGKFQPVYDSNDPYSARFDASDLIDIFASYQSYFDRSRLTQRFGVEYLALEKGTSQIVYSYDYQEKKGVSQRLPPIPYYEIKAEF